MNSKTIGFLAGISALALAFLAPPPGGMPTDAWKVAGMAIMMASWWISECLPISATALIPIFLLPLLGVSSPVSAAAPFADPIIFLFLGGFIIGIAMQRWDLHRRVGLRVIMLAGTTPNRLLGGFLLSTAAISMWVSNTATAIMMLPVAISVTSLVCSTASGGHADEKESSNRNLQIILILAVAYGASIGGLATLIGTPPNALLAGYLSREHGITLGFARWMIVGVPVTLLMLAACWALLLRLFPVAPETGAGAHAIIERELAALGPISTAEKRVAAIFVLIALGWITRPLYAHLVPGINDASIAIAGALMLFALPSGMKEGGRLLEWNDLRALPWGVLILFGGGLSLADAISTSGLAAWLGAMMQGIATWPPLLVIAIATIGMIFLTEITSNTASAATFLPFGGAIAAGIGMDPLLLTVPLALAASCAFMLPVATPPNAIVYASNRIAVGHMVRAGFWLNLIGAAIILAATLTTADLIAPR